MAQDAVESIQTIEAIFTAVDFANGLFDDVLYAHGDVAVLATTGLGCPDFLRSIECGLQSSHQQRFFESNVCILECNFIVGFLVWN